MNSDEIVIFMLDTLPTQNICLLDLFKFFPFRIVQTDSEEFYLFNGKLNRDNLRLQTKMWQIGEFLSFF